jgi:hypothetical protein
MQYDLQRHDKIKIMFGYYGFFVAVVSLILAVLQMLKIC